MNSISSLIKKPNIKISFGDDANFHIEFHSIHPPNKFQRWMLQKILGIRMENI